MFYAVLGAAFFCTFAMMIREGFWSNVISLMSFVLSGLIAFSFFQPLASWLDAQTSGSYTHYWDITSLWTIFVVAMLVISMLAGAVSKTRMRFAKPIDDIGGPVTALVAGLVMASFVVATLHAAPLVKDVLGGKLVHSKDDVENMSIVSAPDLAWLRFAQLVLQPNRMGFGEHGFNAAQYVSAYTAHREAFEESDSWSAERG